MRTAVLSIVTVLAVSILPDTIRAAVIDLGKQDRGNIEGICAREGGHFTSYSDGGYNCTKACKGGNCYVTCDKDNNCTGTTPEARTAGKTIRDILNPAGIAQFEPSNQKPKLPGAGLLDTSSPGFATQGPGAGGGGTTPAPVQLQ